MKLALPKGAISVTLYLFIQDSSSTTGAGLTGLLFNTASLTAYYVRPLASATSITLATQTVTGAWSSGGFVEVSSANMPGVYRFDIPDAALASGVDSVSLLFKGAADMAPLPLEIQLTSVNFNDSVRFGITALPNAAAEAAGGLYTRGSGAGQINQNANGQADSRTVVISNDVITAAALNADAVTEIQSGLATAASIAALNDLSAAEVNAEVVDVVRTDIIPDSVATDGTRPTMAQALLMICRFLMEKEVVSTTVTVNKEDGTTESMTFTLDDATNPTTITRAT